MLAVTILDGSLFVAHVGKMGHVGFGLVTLSSGVGGHLSTRVKLEN